jgi:hypothetical protein
MNTPTTGASTRATLPGIDKLALATANIARVSLEHAIRDYELAGFDALVIEPLREALRLVVRSIKEMTA